MNGNNSIQIRERKYKLKKIERLGKPAMGLVLNGIRKGRTYAEIAKMLSETYGKKIEHYDVQKVMDSNAELMVGYQKEIANRDLQKANMVLDECRVMVDDMEKLDLVFQQLESKVRNGVDTKNLSEISKAMTDMARTRTAMMKSFKKLTGQYKESPMVVVDQSTKTLNIQSSPEAINKLQKELAKAEFITNRKVIDNKETNKEMDNEMTEEELKEDNEIDNIVDAEFEAEETGDKGEEGKEKNKEGEIDGIQQKAG